jgi:hypothetical protein
LNFIFIVDVATPLNNQGVVIFKKYFRLYSSFALSNGQKGENKKQTFDYFNNGAQYTMGIE